MSRSPWALMATFNASHFSAFYRHHVSVYRWLAEGSTRRTEADFDSKVLQNAKDSLDNDRTVLVYRRVNESGKSLRGKQY